VLVVTSVVKTQAQSQEGFELDPNYQLIRRWSYPRLRISKLQLLPGKNAEAWTAAGENTKVTLSYAKNGCFGYGERVLDRVNLRVIAWPANPFVDAYGVLGVRNNVTEPYTVQLRSCGQPVLRDHLTDYGGTFYGVELTFRLDARVLRDSLWGYRNNLPYQIAVWEDLLDQADATKPRTRAWITEGCRSTWSRSQEDLLPGACTHLMAGAWSRMSIGAAHGLGTFGVEIVIAPLTRFTKLEIPNASVHNAAVYVLVLLLPFAFGFYRRARRADKRFWPNETDTKTVVVEMQMDPDSIVPNGSWIEGAFANRRSKWIAEFEALIMHP